MQLRIILLIMLILAGCTPALDDLHLPSATTLPEDARGQKTPTTVGKSKSQEDLSARIIATLERVSQRHLSTRDHGAWQIVHGIIPFREKFLVEHEGRLVPALPLLLSGGAVEGWEFESGVKLSGQQNRRGLRSVVRPGSPRAQGHPDQWLGYLAICELPAETELIVNGETFTLADALGQLEYDVPHNVTREYSWTLMALAQYRPHDHTWTAADGQTWSVSQLVESELEAGLDDAPCGGAHRMTGLALARRRWLRDRGTSSPVWQRLDQQLAELVTRVREYQNSDGTLSSDSFARPFKSADVGQEIAATGHVLEFLAIQLDDGEIRQPWVARAASALCRLLEDTDPFALHCGALYHAASGLRLYNERISGDLEKTSDNHRINQE